jgi:hypothetical protein
MEQTRPVLVAQIFKKQTIVLSPSRFSTPHASSLFINQREWGRWKERKRKCSISEGVTRTRAVIRFSSRFVTRHKRAPAPTGLWNTVSDLRHRVTWPCRATRISSPHACRTNQGQKLRTAMNQWPAQLHGMFQKTVHCSFCETDEQQTPRFPCPL